MNHTKTNSDPVSELYEPGVKAARINYADASGFRSAVDSDAQPDFLLRFLIEFCSLGVQMTEPVDRWIREAGARCVEEGFEDLGLALMRHAEHEAGHHHMMIDDTHRLCEVWNKRGMPRLDSEQLIARPPTPGVVAYVALHERTIKSDAPWAQLAIEFEIELLSVTAGPVLMSNVAAICGQERLADLSFVQDHIELDAGHTAFNRRQLDALLRTHPFMGKQLSETGCAALRAHSLFVDDCANGALT